RQTAKAAAKTTCFTRATDGMRRARLSHPFERHRYALPDADAHGGERAFRTALPQLKGCRAGDAGTRHAERMAKRNGAAIRVHMFRVFGDAEGAQHGDALRRKCLVE